MPGVRWISFLFQEYANLNSFKPLKKKGSAKTACRFPCSCRGVRMYPLLSRARKNPGRRIAQVSRKIDPPTRFSVDNYGRYLIAQPDIISSCPGVAYSCSKSEVG